MIINELVCKPDGMQEIVPREVTDDFFTSSTPQPTTEERLASAEAAITALMGV